MRLLMPLHSYATEDKIKNLYAYGIFDLIFYFSGCVLLPIIGGIFFGLEDWDRPEDILGYCIAAIIFNSVYLFGLQLYDTIRIIKLLKNNFTDQKEI